MTTTPPRPGPLMQAFLEGSDSPVPPPELWEKTARLYAGVERVLQRRALSAGGATTPDDLLGIIFAVSADVEAAEVAKK